jgi:hypothetical protein
MRPQRTKNVLVLTTAAAAAVLLLSGCGAGAAQTQSTSQPAATTVSPASPAPSNAAGAAEPTSASSSPASSSPASTHPATQSGPALCKAAGLTASTEVTGAAAGSVYLEVILSNAGTVPCLLTGFPGVSLTADANGEPIGAAAVRDGSSPVTDVVLAPGQAGTATLRYTQAGNYPDCSRTEAAGLRIYPPEDTASLFVADPRDACRNADINLLTIGPFRAR